MNTDFDFEEFKSQAINELKAGKGFSGSDNVLLPMIKHLLESSLKAELDIHIKDEKQNNPHNRNRKNGSTPKTMKTNIGEFELDTPRDRDGNFTPDIVSKQQTFLGDTFAENILSLYSKGLSYREIQKHLKDLYGTNISIGKMTEITDRVIPEIDQWKSRMLEPIYSIIWMDALHFSVRESGRTIKKAIYIVLGLDMHGKKDVLGFYLGENESSKFWQTVLTDLQNRGVKDIFIACIDNLSGFKEAISASFPFTEVQLCIIHQLRNSMKYVSRKYRKDVLSDLQAIYKATNLDGAKLAMDEFESKWDERYPLIVSSWRNNWENLICYFDYSTDIRRIMYTTNTVEGLNRQIRKYTKTRGPFSNDKALMKLVYVAIKEISSKWTGKPPYWGQVEQQLRIRFEERCIEMY